MSTAATTRGGTGIWLSEALAQDLDRDPGATLATTTGPAAVSASETVTLESYLVEVLPGQ